MRNEKNRKFTDEQIANYRKWLVELEKEASETGRGVKECNRDVWKIFDPDSAPGYHIYMSFSDEELLDQLLQTMEYPRYQFHFEKIYYINKEYIRKRFGGLDRAAKQAHIRRKQLRDQARWPSDWPDRVSMIRFVEKMQRRGKVLTADDYAMLERLCCAARESRRPPMLSASEKKRLNTLDNWRIALELMGIPALNKQARANMLRYWEKCENMSIESGTGGVEYDEQ